MLCFSASRSKDGKFFFRSLLLALCSLFLAPAYGQIKYEVEAQAVGTTNNVVPFWMRSNRYGSIPQAGVSTSYLGRVRKDFLKGAEKNIWDWGMDFEGRLNSNLKEHEILITEGYLKGKLGSLELQAGRIKETMGITGDSLLTSGSFAISGNALGIPKAQLLISEYHPVPIFGRIVAIKGNWAHGWLGKLSIVQDSLRNSVPSYFHQKSLYGRFGKDSWRMKLYAGFNHQVFWGNEHKIFGSEFRLRPVQAYKYVILGKAFGNRAIVRSKIGNHLGSIDLAASYRFKHIYTQLYRQNFYETGALYRMANILDGLTGIIVTNEASGRKETIFSWNKVLFEFFHSKNQAGEAWSKKTNSGDEDYYNSYVYTQGWSYKSVGLGSPFISTKNSIEPHLIQDPEDYFSNNRVIAFHTAISFRIKTSTFGTKFSYSKNFGTYATSFPGRTRGSKIEPPRYGLFGIREQASFELHSERKISEDFKIAYSGFLDVGGLLPESAGAICKLTISL